MQSDPEPTPGALAPRSPTSLVEHQAALTGGAGLFDHSARDAVPPSAGLWAGVAALVLCVAAAAWLVGMNPSFASGKAGGTPNQLRAAAGAAGAGLEPGSPAFEGAQIIAAKQCVSCHIIPGVPNATGTVGPNLAGVASRTKIAGGAVNNTGPDDLRKWIADPPALKPGTAMIKVPLTDDELTRVVAFLETLK